MTVNKWTLGLAAVGLVSLPGLVQAEEKLSPVQSLVSGTTISGYVNASAQWNIGTGNANMPSYGIGSANNQAKADGFNLDAFSLAVEKPLDATDNWAAGYKAELILGQDSQWAGVNNGLKQAYVALRAPVGNGIDFKMGQFDTIIGYESFNAGANPNYTRSYGWAMEPTTHQGILASYQINKIIGVAGGVANTWGPGPGGKAWSSYDNQATGQSKAESFKTYMGAITLTAPESMGFLAGSTLYSGVVSGFDAGSASSTTATTVGPVTTLKSTTIQQNVTSLYVGATANTPVKALKVGAAFDYKFYNKFGDTGNGVDIQSPGYQQAVAGYLSYQITEKLSVHSRSEYAAQSGLYSGPSGNPGNGDTIGTEPYRKVFAQTATVQYDLWKNVLTRLEFRWDHSLDDVNRYGGDTTSPTIKDGNGNTLAAGTRGNAYLLALNVIYKF